MWRITWRCFTHGEQSRSEEQFVNRSPYTGAVPNPRCPACGHAMKMSSVEDLRPKHRPGPRDRKVTRWMTFAQLDLFEKNRWDW